MLFFVEASAILLPMKQSAERNYLLFGEIKSLMILFFSVLALGLFAQAGTSESDSKPLNAAKPSAVLLDVLSDQAAALSPEALSRALSFSASQEGDAAFLGLSFKEKRSIRAFEGLLSAGDPGAIGLYIREYQLFADPEYARIFQSALVRLFSRSKNDSRYNELKKSLVELEQWVDSNKAFVPKNDNPGIWIIKDISYPEPVLAALDKAISALPESIRQKCLFRIEQPIDYSVMVVLRANGGILSQGIKPQESTSMGFEYRFDADALLRRLAELEGHQSPIGRAGENRPDRDRAQLTAAYYACEAARNHDLISLKGRRYRMKSVQIDNRERRLYSPDGIHPPIYLSEDEMVALILEAYSFGSVRELVAAYRALPALRQRSVNAEELE